MNRTLHDHGRWRRRALTIPGVLLGAALLWALLPALLLAAAVADGVERRRGRFVRFVAFAAVYALAEVVGLATALLLWLARPALGAERTTAANFRLQIVWAGALFRVGTRILGMRVRFDGEARPGDRPVVALVRHASLVDSLLPTALLSARHGIRLRHVMKRELLLDPCMDVVGQRLPMAFIRRGADAPEREASRIAALARDMGPGEGALLFPEGTRATPEARRRALERLRETGDRERLAWAEQLRHVLPPRRRGALALLEAAPDADVLVLAHTGFEGAASVRQILQGALIGREVRVRSWLVEAGRVPREPEERSAWLDRQWTLVDAWLADVHGEERDD